MKTLSLFVHLESFLDPKSSRSASILVGFCFSGNESQGNLGLSILFALAELSPVDLLTTISESLL